MQARVLRGEAATGCDIDDQQHLPAVVGERCRGAVESLHHFRTLSDQILQRADAIELIDLPPEDLIKRLQDGKVYVPQQIGRALDNFFGKGKLTALRELALASANTVRAIGDKQIANVIVRAPKLVNIATK